MKRLILTSVAVFIGLYCMVSGKSFAQVYIYQTEEKNSVAYYKFLEQLDKNAEENMDCEVNAAAEELSSIGKMLKYLVVSQETTEGWIEESWEHNIQPKLTKQEEYWEAQLNYFIEKLGSNNHKYLLEIKKCHEIDNYTKEKIANTYSWSSYQLAEDINDIKETYCNIKERINKITKDKKFKNGFLSGRLVSKIIYSLPKAILKKSGKRALSATSMALLDGPLPVGDIAALGAEVLIGLDTAWDLYTIRKPLKKEIEIALKEAIENCKNGHKAKIKQAAREILEQYNKQLYKILE
ncbi:MAG: hypothetical protein HUU50_19670 [Candidatus Brocadiae bacterium]|nr:hypothetical protein [Candidatus Brocadiia bacterium]